MSNAPSDVQMNIYVDELPTFVKFLNRSLEKAHMGDFSQEEWDDIFSIIDDFKSFALLYTWLWHKLNGSSSIAM